MFVGSDALALAPLTTRIAYLEEGDYAAVTRSGARIFDAAGAPVERPVRNVPVATAMVGKDGHRHFMAKEIHEQPASRPTRCRRACRRTAAASSRRRSGGLGGARPGERGRLRHGALRRHGREILARGDRATAGRMSRSPRSSAIASRRCAGRRGDLRQPVRRDGGHAGGAALRKAPGQTTIAVVNVETSTMAREADVVVPIHAGPEIGVASTKAFTAQLIALAALAGVAAAARRARRGRGGAAAAASRSAQARWRRRLALEPALAALADDIAGAQTRSISAAARCIRWRWRARSS
jgi:glucosamine--fructose-6-phosphate aminotransferase (isomerizing)